MKIAVVGSGISGLVAARLLDKKHDVTILEANDYVGGHTHTHDIELPEQTWRVDTGFIVYNDRTYPNFIKLMDQLGIGCKPTTMSFGISDELLNIEYNTVSLASMFAQRSNIIRLKFYRFIGEILRFNRVTNDILANSPNELEQLTLANFLKQHNFSDEFARLYILPMVAAVWSSSFSTAGEYPMLALLSFLCNHGLLTTNDQPQWQVIENGSNSYVKALLNEFSGRVNTSSPVISVKDEDGGVAVTTPNGTDVYERVVFACHSDQALKMLDHPTQAEKEVLGGIAYQANETVLHTDAKMLPKRRRAWGAWNYRVPKQDPGNTSLTYNMNILQGLDASETFCVTLNQTSMIDESKILQVIQYDHPVYNHSTVTAQKRWKDISSHETKKFFCGAYWFSGFHEDGVNSALRVCKEFDLSLDS